MEAHTFPTLTPQVHTPFFSLFFYFLFHLERNPGLFQPATSSRRGTTSRISLLTSSVMAHVCVWFLYAALSVLIVLGKQDAQPLTAPEELKVYREDDPIGLGIQEMKIEWKHGFTNSSTPDKVTFDVWIFYTEQEKLVHNETIELKANHMGNYTWSWISPLPLQCTSHSVQLRYRDQDQTSAWTPQKILPGEDKLDTKETLLYPQNLVALVSEGIRFCCILNSEDKQINSKNFTIRISNRTYITEPIRHPEPSPPMGFDIPCMETGSTYYTGYAPDDHNITCETRDLSSMECHWIHGQQENVSEMVKKTNYFINGRRCSSDQKPGFCVLDMTIDSGEMNWTLTAKNLLGTKIITDTADPKNRVHLKAPVLAPTTQFTARNATLEWNWHELPKYSSFPMKCRVEVNGHIINEIFEGIGLNSVVLRDLQPFTECKARVQCCSLNNCYKWGDWSNLITFVLKEDTPEAVDVWMQIVGEQTYIVWKKLSPAQSHGIIRDYELVIENFTDGNKEPITKSPTELCHKLHAGSAQTYRVISVSAHNSAGASRPSTINIPNMSPGGQVNTSNIYGNNKTFNIAWEVSSRFQCGYVLDWYPTFEAQECAVKWEKYPPGVSNATIYSDFEAGVKYTLSVYGCTSEELHLLQRREGYVTELPPSGTVQNLTVHSNGLDVYLSWENVPEQEQRGFIKGYKVSYSCAGMQNTETLVFHEPSIQKHKFRLMMETYTFTVKAFTSAGEGPGSDITYEMDPQVEQVIISVIAGMVIMISILCITAVFAYRNWKWLKKALWPDVPRPMLSEEFLKKNVYQWQVMDKLLCEESEVLKIKSPELYPAPTLPEKEHLGTQALNSPCSKDSPWYERYHSPNSNPQTLPLITVDLAYKELPCPGIQNPSYNLPLRPEADNILVSGYIPQAQNNSIHNEPYDAQRWSQ